MNCVTTPVLLGARHPLARPAGGRSPTRDVAREVVRLRRDDPAWGAVPGRPDQAAVHSDHRLHVQHSPVDEGLRRRVPPSVLRGDRRRRQLRDQESSGRQVSPDDLARTAGWVIINPKDLKDRGKVVDIKPDGTTDVAKISFNPPKD